MTDQYPAFHIGQIVIHPIHGKVKVHGQDEQEIDGQTVGGYQITYLTRNNTRGFIPFTSPTKLRAVGTGNTLDEVVKELRKRPKTSWEHWKIQSTRYTDRIKTGCLVTIATVIRDLHQEPRNHNIGGLYLYDQAMTRLLEEAAIIWKCTEEMALERLARESGLALHHPNHADLTVSQKTALPTDAGNAATALKRTPPSEILYYPARELTLAVFEAWVELNGDRLNLPLKQWALFQLLLNERGKRVPLAVIARRLQVRQRSLRGMVSQLRIRLDRARFVVKTDNDSYAFVFPEDDHV